MSSGRTSPPPSYTESFVKRVALAMPEGISRVQPRVPPPAPPQRQNTFAPQLARQNTLSMDARKLGGVDHLLSFNSATSSHEGKEAFRAQVDDVRTQLRKHNRGTLDPRSRFVRLWDCVLVIALMHTTFVTPFEVAFSSHGGVAGVDGEGAAASGATDMVGSGAEAVSFVVNRIIDAVFLMDVIISFFMPFRTSQVEGGTWVHDRKRIMQHYLLTWFVPDLCTCIPFDVILSASVDGSDSNLNQNLRMVRMVRVLKLVRIVRATRILKRWQDSVAI